MAPKQQRQELSAYDKNNVSFARRPSVGRRGPSPRVAPEPLPPPPPTAAEAEPEAPAPALPQPPPPLSITSAAAQLGREAVNRVFDTLPLRNASSRPQSAAPHEPLPAPAGSAAPTPPQPSSGSEQPAAEAGWPAPLPAAQQPPLGGTPGSTPRRAGGLYEALKLHQPAEVQEQLELDEAYWDAEGMLERRQELQRRLKDEEMLERIKRRVAGEKINLPSIPMPRVLNRLQTMLSPRGAGLQTSRSQAAAPQSPRQEATADVAQPAAAGEAQGELGEGAGGLHPAAAGPCNQAAGSAQPGVRWHTKVQRAVEKVVQHPDFGVTITLLIALNCVALALYQPQLPDDEGLNKSMKTLQMAINFAFTVEVILTCIAAGGIKEYLRSPWNLFDLSMVLVGYTDFIPTKSGNTGGIKALRALRALRPLRTITRFDSLRSIVVCFLEALPLLLSVYQLLLFFLILAAIMGTILFMDSSRFACFDTVTGEVEQPGNPDFACGIRHCPAGYTCMEYTPAPPLATAGFVNIGASALTCFQVITLSGWVHSMYATMDNAGPCWLIYFVGIVLLEAYFVVNLFLAVLKNKFAKAQQLFSKVVTSEDKQHSTIVTLWKLLVARFKAHSAAKRAADDLRMSERTSRGSSGLSTPSAARQTAHEMLLRRPSMAGRLPKTRLGFFWYWVSNWIGGCWFEFRWHLRQVVEHPIFGQLFLLAIVANTVILSMTTADMSPAYASGIENAARALTIMFIIEAAAKLIGLGVYGYTADTFNLMDFLFAAMGLLELVLMVGANGNAMRSFRTLRILRSLRVLRVLKAFRYLQSLRVITDVLLSSMGSFVAIAGLMTLFIFCWAVIGLQSFGQYDLDPSFPNFHDFWFSFVLVFQTLTLENWAQLMFSVQAVGGWASALYFVAWVAVGKWTLLTLFLAITLSAFEANYEKYNRGTTTGSVARMLGALQSAGEFFRQLFRRGSQVSPSPAVDDSFTKAWVQSCALKAAQASAARVASLGPDDCSASGQQKSPALPALGLEPPPPPPQSPPPLAEDALIPAVHVQQPAAGLHNCTSAQLGHVSGLVQHFESLSPRKQMEPASALAVAPPGQPAAGSATALCSFAAAAAAGVNSTQPQESQPTEPDGAAEGVTAASVLPAEGRTTAPTRMRSRHARFADALDDEGADEPALQKIPSAASSATPEPPLGGAGSVLGGTPGKKGVAELSAPLAQPIKPYPLRRGTDQSVPSDLLEAEQRSELSGFSGASSASSASRLSRLSAHARKRSKRNDFPPLMGTSLFFLKADSKLRGSIYHLVTLHYFDYLLMAVVLLSCVEMAMETPSMDPAATRTVVLKWIDIGTTIVFWVEALLKIVAISFRAYISYFTNKVDFGVVIISTVTIIAESTGARFLKALRVLRAIKPLRVLTRSMSMLLVFHTLTRSLMEMGNVTVLCALCFLIFAILGVQLFAGLFWSCNDPSVAGKSECAGDFMDSTGALVPREWTNLHFNFDNVGNAFITLFITATQDGYTPMMYASMASRAEPGLQPYIGANSAAFLFWFAYITLVAFFVLNLYIGVVFYQFQRLKMLSQTGSAVLTASQTGYVEMMKAVFRLKPLDKAPLPPNPVRRLCHRLAYHPWFDNAMTAVIVANILLLATTYYGEPARFAAGKEYANTAFSAIVILECLIKVAAMGPVLYWRSNWNKFDLALALAAVVDIITQILNAALGGVVNLSTIKKVMMLLRTLRLFKLVRKVKGMQMLLTTLVVSLPAIYNVGSLLLLLFFIYAYMGVLLLGNIKLQDSLNIHASFQTFPKAMLLLFRVAVGDDWTSMMQECMVRPPDCDLTAGECGFQWVWVYFFSFYLSVGLVAFNLFTTVVLETFERVSDTAAWSLTPAALDEFCEAWAQYDDGTSLIEPKHLEQILMRLPPPMGLGCKASGADVLHFVFSLDIPLVDGKVAFHRVAFELVRKSTIVEIPPGELKRKLDRMIRRFLNKHTPAGGGPVDEHMSFSVALTVMRIQRHWRALTARRAALRAEAEARAAARRAAGLPSQSEEAEQLAAAADELDCPAAQDHHASAAGRLGRLRSMLSSKHAAQEPQT